MAVFYTLPLSVGAACGGPGPVDLIIEGARLFDYPANSMTISIADGRICEVEPGSTKIAASHAIDARRRTVLPGLIDAHVHLFPMGASSGIDSDVALEEFMRDELPARLQDYLEHGVTTLISVGDAWPAVRELRLQIDSGMLEGPRLLTAGPILTAPGGYPASTICAGNPWCRSRLTVELRDERHARQTVLELAAEGVDAIKFVYDDARAKKLEANIARAVIAEADAHGLPVIVHTTRVSDVLTAAEFGVDVLAHLPADGALEMGVTDKLRQRGVTVLSTAGVYGPIDGPGGRRQTVFGLPYGPPFDRFYAGGIRNAAMLLKQGIPLAFGSGTAMFEPAQSLRVELAALAEVPMSSAQILTAMTINAARAIGKASELGSIAPGKLADLIIVDSAAADVMPASTDITVVIKAGRIVINRQPL